MMSLHKILIGTLCLTGVLTASAQSSSNTPYSRYGLGDLSDRIFAGNAAMGGIGFAYRTPFHINPMNPASYSAVDSLAFMFDMGLSLKHTQFKEKGLKINANNSSFDYLAMQFRLHPRVGFALGILPYSTVGYNFSYTNPIENTSSYSTNTMSGTGGLQQVFTGVGVKVLPNLSLGVNLGYLYGTLEYKNTLTLSNGGDQTINTNNLRVTSYTVNVGAQYTHKLNDKNEITIGATYELGHKLNSKETRITSLTDGTTGGYTKTTQSELLDAYSLPHSFGAGVSWLNNKRWLFSADYSLQQWKNATYADSKNAYLNRTRIAIGAELTPNYQSRRYFSRIRYRFGAFYSTPYITTPIGDGPKEYGISAGFGLPLNNYQRNSILNITGQFVRVSPSATDLMAENRFVIKVGLTFNERWFMKWKIQ